MPSSSEPYGVVARCFHWLTAILVLSVIPGGIVMNRIGSGPTQNLLYDLHRSVGFVILCLVVLRLLWRLTHPAPPLPAHMPAIQKFAAEAVHWLLYLLLIVQPIVGWIATNAYGATISVFWMFNLPALLAKDEPLSKILFAAHETMGLAIAALVALHFAAVLFHTFVQKDGLMRRMWPA